MSQIDFKGDKSWFIIIALFFFMFPLGIVALIAKIIYMIYQGQNTEDSPSVSSSYDRRPVYRDINTYNDDSADVSLSHIEEDLKDSFSEWQENRKSGDAIEDLGDNSVAFTMDSYTEAGLPVEIHSDVSSTIDMEIKDDVESEERITFDPLETEHLEDELNESLKELSVIVPVEVDVDIDLTFTDVHIDTEITFSEEPEDHDHEGETPLKVITCTMCDTKNRIYKIDVFETPTCEKCGMLLLDRH